MPSAGFEPAIPASERPQTRALDRAATGVGVLRVILTKFYMYFTSHTIFVCSVRPVLLE